LHEDEDVEYNRLVGAVKLHGVALVCVIGDVPVQLDLPIRSAEDGLHGAAGLLATGDEAVGHLEEDAHHPRLHEPHDAHADHDALVDDAFTFVLGLALEQFVRGHVSSKG